MCGRYSLSTTAELVEEVFGVVAAEDLAPRWNIAPSEPAPVVRPAEGDGRRLDLLRWGIVAEGGRRKSGAAAATLLINARAETAAALPAFREGFRSRRCLVPADGFYEWVQRPHGRLPHHIRFRDRRLFALAGLWSPGEERDVAALERFTILTCPPSGLVRPLHDRMPVILPPSAWEEWLQGTDAAALESLLVPWEGPEMEAVAVSPYVNRAGNEGPECLAPPPGRQEQRSLFP